MSEEPVVEVHMRDARIDAARLELILGQPFAALKVEGVRAAESEMVGGILVEQRVVVENVGAGK